MASPINKVIQPVVDKAVSRAGGAGGRGAIIPPNLTIVDQYGNTSGKSPDSRAIVQAMVTAVQNGQKLTKEELFQLNTALAGLNDIEDRELKAQAARDLQGYANALPMLSTQAYTGKSESIERQAGVVGAATGRDLTSEETLRRAGAGANAADADTVGRLRTGNEALLGADLGIWEGQRGVLAGSAEQDIASVGRFGGVVQGANRQDQYDLDELRDADMDAERERREALAGLGGKYGLLDDSDDQAVDQLEGAFGGLERIEGPEYGPDVTSEAALAAADPESIAAQREYMGTLRGRMSPTITASEKFNFEVARRQEEQDRRNAMEAQLGSLRARGALGSGAEIGALYGASSITSQNRMLQDLAALKQAQERSERATTEFGNSAGKIRSQSFGEQFDTGTAADQAAEFNKTNSQTAKRFAAEKAIEQNRDEAGRATTLADTKLGVNETSGQRARDIYEGETDNADTGFKRGETVANESQERNESTVDRGSDVMDAEMTATGNYVDRSNTVADAGYGITTRAGVRGQDQADTELGASETGYKRGVTQADFETGVTDTAVKRAEDVEKEKREALDKLTTDAEKTFDANATIAGVKTGAPSNQTANAIKGLLSEAEFQQYLKVMESGDEGLIDQFFKAVGL